MINNQFVPDWVIELYVKEEHVSASNCIVCYIPNGFKDKKKKSEHLYKEKKVTMILMFPKNILRN